MNIAGVVILYQPPLSVIPNIATYLPFLDTLYVFDNTETKDELLHQQLLMLEKVVLIHENKNKGIATRLNEAARFSLAQKYDWLLTMDQDSSFDSKALKRYISCIEAVEQKDKIAMFGINHESDNHIADCNCIEAVHLITSGSIINLSLFNKTGGFDEALFIDEVDIDYCYNAIIKGYKLFKFKNIFLNHSLGTKSYHKSLKSFKITSRTLHSPERLYYMVRNYFYVNKKYPDQFLKEKKIRKIDLLNRIKNNFLYGDQRMRTLRYVVKGWMDYMVKTNKSK